MKKLILMLAVAAFGTGAMAQNGATKTATPAQTQTPKTATPAAKPKAETKPKAEASKTSTDKSVGQKPKKSHHHTVEPTKKQTM